jgi:hypothetical protein
LATWLGVTPEWLRYGESDVASASAVKEPTLSEGDLDVIRQFRRLNAGHRQLVREILLSLLNIEQRK